MVNDKLAFFFPTFSILVNLKNKYATYKELKLKMI